MKEHTMIPTAAQVADALNAAELPTAATKIGVSVDATTTTVTLRFAADSMTYDQAAQTLTITLGTGNPITVPLREGQDANGIASIMIDSLLPATHAPTHAAPVRRSWFHLI